MQTLISGYTMIETIFIDIFSCSNLIVNKMQIKDGMKWNAHCYVHLLKLEYLASDFSKFGK